MSAKSKTEPETYQVRLRCWHFVYIGPGGDGLPPHGGAWCARCQRHSYIVSAIRLADA